MREIKALSPTSLELYWKDTEMWYLKYCSDTRLPKQPQTQPMSVGSAFDAFIKAILYQKFHGVNDKFVAQNLFEAQVEPQNREFAMEAGLNCLSQYQRSGALADLLLETSQLQTKPQFEFTLREKINFNGFDVPIMGIPDMYYMSSDGIRVILDFKVNGYCSKSITSPAPGYVISRDGWEFGKHKPTVSHRKPHKNAGFLKYKGLRISSVPLEEAQETWAAQTTTYGWLLGEPVGSVNFIAAIEQLAGYPFGGCPPGIRIASHRSVISPNYQETLVQKYVQCWTAYTTGHIFIMESRKDSDDKCAFLEKLATILMTGDVNSSEFNAAVNHLQGRNFYDANRDFRGDIIRSREASGEIGLSDNDHTTSTDSKPLIRTGTGLIGLAKNPNVPISTGIGTNECPNQTS